MTKDMRIRFSGRDLQMLEDLAAFRGLLPRLMIKLLIEEAYAVDEQPIRMVAAKAAAIQKRDDKPAELDDELPF